VLAGRHSEAYRSVPLYMRRVNFARVIGIVLIPTSNMRKSETGFSNLLLKKNKSIDEQMK
jgi:hypothetical protein